MAGITAAAVKSLRDRTGLPMMKCKKALEAADGDQDVAMRNLREEGAKTQAIRSDRETAFGRMGIYFGLDKTAGAMVEVKCESAPVAGHEEFVEFAQSLAQQLATGPGAGTADELLAQPSPAKEGANALPNTRPGTTPAFFTRASTTAPAVCAPRTAGTGNSRCRISASVRTSRSTFAAR